MSKIFDNGSLLETVALGGIFALVGANAAVVMRENGVLMPKDLLMPAALGVIFSHAFGSKFPSGYLVNPAVCTAGYSVGNFIANYAVRMGIA